MSYFKIGSNWCGELYLRATQSLGVLREVNERVESVHVEHYNKICTEDKTEDYRFVCTDKGEENTFRVVYSKNADCPHVFLEKVEVTINGEPWVPCETSDNTRAPCDNRCCVISYVNDDSETENDADGSYTDPTIDARTQAAKAEMADSESSLTGEIKLVCFSPCKCMHYNIVIGVYLDDLLLFEIMKGPGNHELETDSRFFALLDRWRKN
jgi:hypothetical protein